MTASETAPPLDAPKRAGTYGLRTLIFVSLLCSTLTGVFGFLLARRHGITGFATSSTPAAARAEMYQCPMHPTLVADHPADCPICGMKLVKVGAAQTNAMAASAHAEAADSKPPTTRGGPGSEPDVAGLAPVDIDPTRQQLIGLVTEPVTSMKMGGSWRTVGRVVVDETRVHHVNIKVAGYVEHVYVDFIGKHVNRGTPLFSMYSPELLAAQDEYLLALKSRAVLNSANTNSSGDNDALVNAVRRKLALWDMSNQAIESLGQNGQSARAITVYSPAAGVVTKKDVVHGMKLDAGAMPYEIVDLSSVWVIADVYESELRFVKVGMPATLTLNAFPDREFNGRATFIDPMLDPTTRTVKVRLAFANPTKDLRPEMFGEVVLKGLPHDALVVPADAVIDSGINRIVFVALGGGRFRPRTGRLGVSDGNYVQVVTGLTQGESVVTRANFLIDSESRLRASLAALTHDSGMPQPESARILPGTDSPSPTAMPSAAAPPTAGSVRDAKLGHGAHGT